jgi:hypothetical protein
MSTTREVAEEWRSVNEWKGYEVSNLGRLRSLFYSNGTRRATPLMKKSRPLDSGHNVYMLCRDRKTTSRMASRLVLLAFKGPPSDPAFEASHLDGNVSNDHIDNLLWESHVDNESRKVGHGTRLQGERVPHAKMTDAQVLEFRRRFANGEPFVSLLKESGVSWGAFHPAMHGKTWKHLNPATAIREGKPQ